MANGTPNIVSRPGVAAAVGIYGRSGAPLLGPQTGNETPASANSGYYGGPDSTDPIQVLTKATNENADYLERLADRLAPAQLLFIPVQFINPTGGGIVQGKSFNVPVPGPFNKIINNLTRGTVNVYFGVQGNIWSFQLGPVANPTPTYFPPQWWQNVIFEVDPGSSTDAFGVVYLVNL